MTRYPAMSRADHQQFCEREGWQRTETGHHLTYVLPLPSGEVLRTRISRPPNRSTYGASIASHILRNQLQVTAQQFWACVRDGELPPRGTLVATRPTIPASLLASAQRELGMSDAELASLPKDEIIARLAAHWSRIG